MYSKSEPPIAISHRGLHHNAPENSIPAFLAAIDAGALAIELDVHTSADSVIHVHHDPAPGGLDPKGNQWKAIAELTSAELKQARLFGEVAIPTLDEVIEAVDGRAGIFIEVKGLGMEDALVRCLKRHLGRIDQLAVHSFDHRIIRRIAGLLPSVRTGLLQVSYLVDSCALLRQSGATDLWQQVDFIDAELVSGVHACRGKVIAWTANTVEQWERLYHLNVDGICTDKVDEYVAWAAARK
ncbi:MAG TPA: glycerophosphodiester phosphodiesterase [Gemmatimonadaceae bacterium]|nr:glycerophosphodiester phosphodiesterase [Gemmatimonadaceae bacterium]